MQWLWDKVQAEPNALSELVRQFVYLLLGFELLKWTDPQIALVLAFISGLLSWLTRKVVLPTATITQAGHSVSQIKADAATNVVQQEAAKQGISLPPPPQPPLPPEPPDSTQP